MSSGYDTQHTLFALLIGIDRYRKENFINLECAVRDADAIRDLLQHRLGVPTSRIQNLRNSDCTRRNVIAAIKSLGNNSLIEKDDPILIYFAGHGGRVSMPGSWVDWASHNLMVEVIGTWDVGITDLDGSEIPGIPDRTVSVLLHDLAASKGNNITLILDCCHAAGISRNSEDVELTLRGLENLPPIPDECDTSILSPEDPARTALVTEGIFGTHHDSHVLLAACGRSESAFENPRTGHGVFTSALVKLLEEINPSELTYTSLMHRMRLKLQTPHCEGQHVHRRLFDKRAPGANRSLILCGLQRDGTVILHAGAAQGFETNSKFSAHATNLVSDKNPSLGVLVLVSLQPLFSTLSYTPGSKAFSLPHIFYGRLIERAPVKKYRLYCTDEEWLEEVISFEDDDSMGTEFVNNVDQADLCLVVHGDEVHFDRNDLLASAHIDLKRLPHVMNAQDKEGIRHVIKCAVHYQYHLTRTGEDFRLEDVTLELNELQPVYSDLWLSPTGRNYFEDDPAVIPIGDESRCYGLTIHNHTELSLYPYVFYFDPSNLEIIEWYMSPFGAGVESYSSVDDPLPPKSKLTIGFGDGGASPWHFSLHDGEDVDVGFFKLFLTTAPANFAMIHQETPFVSAESARAIQAVKRYLQFNMWGTKLVTAVQRRMPQSK